jgi:type II secretory pathway component PulK
MRRRGTILVAVLVIVALAVLAAGTLMYRTQAEITAAVTGARRQQAYSVAISGLQRAMAMASNYRLNKEMWYDNPEIFKGQLVCDDGVNKWFFTIYAYNPADPDTLRHGLDDEASRINLNTADANALMALPNMTPELVDCLLDYLDKDETARPQGAEQEYYSQLPHPYLIRNGPLSTLEEVLLVKGFDASIVYGEDYNLNGMLEKNEDDHDESFPPDDGDGKLDRGLMGVATVWSYEPNVDNQGKARTNIATAIPPAGTVSEQVDEFLECLKADGNSLADPSELLEGRHRMKRAFAPKHKAGEMVESGVKAADLPAVMDKLTTKGPVLAGLVNVNTATAEVLAALPGVGKELADGIVAARTQADPAVTDTIAWLYTENVVPADKFKEIAPLLTARSYQFHVHCVAYGWPCGQFRVIEAVIDTARGAPRIIYQRDLTKLGMPFPIDVEQKEQVP